MAKHTLLTRYILVISTLLSQHLYQTNSFIAGKQIVDNHKRKSSPSSLHGTVRFEGDASSDTLIRFTGDENDDSLLKWLKSSESDKALLGTENFEYREDGLWDCLQPPVSWFGLELKPVFVNRIDRSSKDKVIVTIVETHTDFSNAKSGNNAIRQIMEKCSFSGSNTFTLQRNAKSWSLSSDLKLALNIPLPPFVPLPPGFNSIGSKIISRTCNARVKENLESVKNAYLDWTKINDSK